VGVVESLDVLTEVMVQLRADVRHDDVPVTAPAAVTYSLMTPEGSVTVIA
jgi:hypothetical protein